MPAAVERCVNSDKWKGKINPRTHKPYTESEKWAICTWSYNRGRLSMSGDVLGEKDALRKFNENPGWFYSEYRKLKNRHFLTLGDFFTRSKPQNSRQPTNKSEKNVFERLREKHVNRIRHTKRYNDWLRRQTSLAKWTRKYINSLPNSSFAAIEPAYLQGKTDNKNARHLPFKDANGKVDLPHLRNALARMNQIQPVTDSISAEALRAKAKAKLLPYAKRYLPNSKWARNGGE